MLLLKYQMYNITKILLKSLKIIQLAPKEMYEMKYIPAKCWQSKNAEFCTH